MTETVVAALGTRLFPEAPACSHCRAPVRATMTGMGRVVEHYDPDASFRDSIWRYCRVTVARMPEETTRART